MPNRNTSKVKRAIKAWKINLLQKTKSGKNMAHVCTSLTTKLGITDDGTQCSDFISCMTESEINTLPDCEQVKKCILMVGSENTTIPSCTDIMSFTKSTIWAIHEKRSRQLKSVDESCLTFDEIVHFLENYYSTDFCVLQNMGWMDNNNEFIEDVVVADLPEDIAAGLDNWAECTIDLVDQYAKDE